MNEPTWRSLYTRYGMADQLAQGVITEDPFTAMATYAKNGGLPHATVSINMGTAVDFGKQKFSVTITAPCPAGEAPISFLTEAAFILAKRLVNQGAETLGLPSLGEVNAS